MRVKKVKKNGKVLEIAELSVIRAGNKYALRLPKSWGEYLRENKKARGPAFFDPVEFKLVWAGTKDVVRKRKEGGDADVSGNRS